MASLNYLNYRHVLHELHLILDLFDPTTWHFWRPCVTRPFVKYVNYNHIMPTRYQVGLGFANGAWLTNMESENWKQKHISHVSLPNYLWEGYVPGRVSIHVLASEYQFSVVLEPQNPSRCVRFP